MRLTRRALIWLIALNLTACDGDIFTPAQHLGDPTDPTTTMTAMAPLVWLPQRVRRLSNRELDNTVSDLLGTQTAISTMLPIDVRQSGFTLNADQRVDDTWGGQLETAADTLAQEAVTLRLGALAPCTPGSDARGCAGAFIDSFAARAYRRPLTQDDRTGLLAVYDVAAGGTFPDGGTIGTYSDGIASVLSAVLQSGSFLYVTELGDNSGALVELGPYEVASELAFLITGAPPDAELLQAAANDALRTADQREAQARRLATSSPHANPQLARWIKEWLGIDELVHVDRTTTVTDSFASLVPHFDGETDAFIDDVAAHADGKLETLLTASYSDVDSTLAGFYGVADAATSGFAQAPLQAPRAGILTQANFLSTYATNAPPGSSPVKRGKAVLNRMLCQNIQLPVDPALAMQAANPPPADPNETTRQRFEVHASNPACAGCHKLLDGIGFAFENFDQIGKFRSTENGQPIDASGALIGTDVDGTFADATGLVSKLAASEQVRRCFARNFFRFASGQTSDDTEAQYLDVWAAMSHDGRTQLTPLMVGYVRSDLFIQRRAP